MDLNIRRDFKEAGHERQALEKNFSAELNSVVSKIEQQFSEQHGDPYDPVDTGRYPSERFETNETIGSDCSNRTSSVESWAENAEQLLQGKWYSSPVSACSYFRRKRARKLKVFK